MLFHHYISLLLTLHGNKAFAHQRVQLLRGLSYKDYPRLLTVEIQYSILRFVVLRLLAGIRDDLRGVDAHLAIGDYVG